jgi:ubiquinone/menaquinone biosynthesis C-methylase UbiE
MNKNTEVKKEGPKETWNKKISGYFVQEVEPVTCVKSLENFSEVLKIISKGDKKLKIIEIGGGSGIFCKAVLDTFPSLVEEYALVDISEVMVEFAQERLKEYLKQTENFKLSIHLLSMEDLNTISDKHYDIVISNYCIHLVENPAKAFTEVKRVLKPDGNLPLRF